MLLDAVQLRLRGRRADLRLRLRLRGAARAAGRAGRRAQTRRLGQEAPRATSVLSAQAQEARALRERIERRRSSTRSASTSSLRQCARASRSPSRRRAALLLRLLVGLDAGGALNVRDGHTCTPSA